MKMEITDENIYTISASSWTNIHSNPNVMSLRLAKKSDGKVYLQFFSNNEWIDVPVVELNENGEVIG